MFDFEMIRHARNIAIEYQRAMDYGTADFWYRLYMRHRYSIKFHPKFFQV